MCVPASMPQTVIYSHKLEPELLFYSPKLESDPVFCSLFCDSYWFREKRDNHSFPQSNIALFDFIYHNEFHM